MLKLPPPLPRQFWSIALLLATAPCCALNLCVSDRPAAPLTFPDHEGQAQYLARTAALSAGVNPVFMVMPWRRCIEAARLGQVDAVLAAQAFNTYKDFLRFPLKHGVPDSSFALGVDTWVLVARVDAQLSWNGKVLMTLRRQTLTSCRKSGTKYAVSAPARNGASWRPP